MFGGDVYWIYITLITGIGEREKRCFPLLNICPRKWVKWLGEDTNFENFADPTPINFDKWLSDEINNTGGGCQKGKTRFQIMIAKFGKPSTGRNTASTASAAARARNSTAMAAPTNKPPSTEATKPPSKAALVRTIKNRTSKVKSLGRSYQCTAKS